MTINGTAVWLLALYVAMARERGVDERALRGTIQNDIVKEYLARGTYIFPPAPSMDLIAETYEHCVAHMPQWNPSNVCSYHLQEAGATPTQELAFALADAFGVLDRVRARGRVDAGRVSAQCVGRVSASSSTPACGSSRRCARCAAVHRAVGRGVSRALRRHRREAPAVSLRRAGQLARPDRAAAREQRVADPARDARRDALEERALPGAAAAGVERGDVAAAAVGPAVVAAAAADPRVRDRPARVRRPVRGQSGRRREGREPVRRGARRARAHRCDGRHHRRDRQRLLQAHELVRAR